ncbi:unnamed protein product [Closterium sp. NIES-53]
MLSSDDWSTAYPNLVRLWIAVAVLPLSTVECERGFSRQNVIKSWMRSNLCDAMLGKLMTVLLLDYEMEPQAIMSVWHGSKKRRPAKEVVMAQAGRADKRAKRATSSTQASAVAASKAAAVAATRAARDAEAEAAREREEVAAEEARIPVWKRKSKGRVEEEEQVSEDEDKDDCSVSSSDISILGTSLSDQAPPLVVLSRKHARPRQRLSLSLPDTPAMAEITLTTLSQAQLDRLVRQLEDSALEIATLTAERDSARQQSTVNAPAPTNAPAQSEELIIISSGTPTQNNSVGHRSGVASEGTAHSMPGMERNRAAPSPREPREARRHVEFAATSGEYAVTAPMPLMPQRLPCFDPSQHGGPTVQSWVFTMNVFFDANYVESDAAKIRYAVLLLRGPAMD